MESQWPIWPWNKYIFTGSKCIIHFLVNSVEWVCLCIRCDRLCVCALSCFSCIWPFVTPWTIAHQAPLSLGFTRQEYWSGLSCPPPGDLPDPGMEPTSPALQVDSLSLSHQGIPILDSRHLSDTLFVNIFSYSVDYIFAFLNNHKFDFW